MTNETIRTAIQNAQPKQTELSTEDLQAVVGGAQTPTGTAGGGNTSVWSWIKGQVFGVEPSYFEI